MESLENLEIRLLVSDMKLSYKEIASKIGISRQYLSKCLRYPLRPEMRDRILLAINELGRDRENAV